jgi:formate/nitrite transporter FocA (FNT family)
MRLWATVLVANLIGCLAAAWAASSSSAFSDSVRGEFAEIGHQAMDGGFMVHLLHGVFAGWLIALMVWLLPFAESARFWVIIALSYFIGLGHFSHIIAGAVQTFYVAVIGEVAWTRVLANYLVPTFLGNVVGGVTLVAALNHAQVVSGSKDKKPVFGSREYSRATT